MLPACTQLRTRRAPTPDRAANRAVGSTQYAVSDDCLLPTADCRLPI
jgi:hypothetical protein